MPNRFQFHIRVSKSEDVALGPGKIALLEAIVRTGSISAAARTHAMSYRRAWMLVDSMNRSFETPLVVTTTGGKEGGGAAVTPLGQTVITLYREAEDKAFRAASRSIGKLERLLKETLD
jgi:molybdate transport system regulatory protein